MEDHILESTDRPVVFLIEDEEALLEAWVESLNQMGFEAFGFSTASAFYRAFAVSRCHIVVVDVGLPDESGFSIARHIRTIKDIGIVFATGRRQLEDRLEGLRSGGDAFLIKPVHTEELAATLEAVFRRIRLAADGNAKSTASVPVAASPGKLGRWALSEGNWVLGDPAGRQLRLTSSERIVLTLLFKQKNQPVERSQLALALDGDSKEFTPQRVDTLISRLRRKALATGMQLPLHSARGTGYEFHW